MGMVVCANAAVETGIMNNNDKMILLIDFMLLILNWKKKSHCKINKKNSNLLRQIAVFSFFAERARLEISALPRASLHLRTSRRNQVASVFCFFASSCVNKLPPKTLKTKQEHTIVCSWKYSAAERARFELAVGLPLRQFSKLLVSATHPPFRLVHFWNRLQRYNFFLFRQALFTHLLHNFITCKQSVFYDFY